MRIGILGTGTLATALGTVWAAVGHDVVVTGRDDGRARSAARAIGSDAQAKRPADFPPGVDVVVVAVAWPGLVAALTIVGGPDGALAGKVVVDCTNPIDTDTGLIAVGDSAAEIVSRHAPGAHVAKALHLFAGAQWPFSGPRDEAPVVAVCGDDRDALDVVERLVGDLGGRMAVVGNLRATRQVEEAAGFVMRVVAAGANPRDAVPDVPAPGAPPVTESRPVTG